MCYHRGIHQSAGVGPSGPQVLLTSFEMEPHVSSVTSTTDEANQLSSLFTESSLMGPSTDTFTEGSAFALAGHHCCRRYTSEDLHVPGGGGTDLDWFGEI